MPEVFERGTAALSTLNVTDVYQAPNDNPEDIAIVLSCLVANVDPNNEADITIQVTNSGNGIFSRTAREIRVPARSSIELMPNRLILKRGDKIRAQASLVNRLDVTVSVLEITPNVT